MSVDNKLVPFRTKKSAVSACHAVGNHQATCITFLLKLNQSTVSIASILVETSVNQLLARRPSSVQLLTQHRSSNLTWQLSVQLAFVFKLQPVTYQCRFLLHTLANHVFV